LTAEQPPVPRSLWALLGLMIVLWSANFVVAKYVVMHIPPLFTGGLRMTLAALFILPVYFWEGRKIRAHRWTRADLPTLIGIGMLGLAGNQVCFLVGIKRTSVAHGSILFALTPVLVLLIASALKHERITGRKTLGMLVAAAGALALQVTPDDSRQASLSGDMLILGATLAFALFTVFGRSASARLGSITVNTFGYVSCAAALAPVTIWEAWRIDLTTVPLGAWTGLLYMALFPSVVCYTIYYYALTYMAASRVAALTYLEPFLATLLAAAWLGENVTYAVLAGGALVLAGVWMTERSSG
jgi:drug/metabolite transporter (DMT)-like permease